MLSDLLFEIQQKLKNAISHYSTEPFSKDYPQAQEEHLTLAIYHLRLAQMAYDSFEYKDDHKFNTKTKLTIMKESRESFNECLTLGVEYP